MTKTCVGLGLALLCFVYSPWSGSAQAEDTVTVAGGVVPLIFEDGKPAPYNVIFDLLTRNSPDPVVLNMMPSRRAVLTFRAHEADCRFIGSDSINDLEEMGLDVAALLFSKPIQAITAKIYTRTDQPIVASVADLAGKTVAADITVNEASALKAGYFGASVTVLPVNSFEQGLVLLQQRRVAAVVGFDVDMRVLRQKADAPLDFHTDDALMLFEENDTFVCWRSEKTQAFIEHVDRQLDQLKESGRLELILYPDH